MFFWFFQSLSLFLHHTNGIDECKKSYATQFNQNMPDGDNIWSVKCSKMTFFGHVSENMKQNIKYQSKRWKSDFISNSSFSICICKNIKQPIGLNHPDCFLKIHQRWIKLWIDHKRIILTKVIFPEQRAKENPTSKHCSVLISITVTGS